MNDFKILKSLLSEEGSKFPAKVTVLAGKTLYFRDKGYWKAVLLVEVKYGEDVKKQLRLYCWRWNKKKTKWSQIQKFNVSGAKYIVDLLDLLHIYAQECGNEVVLKKINDKLLARVNELEKTNIQLEKQKSTTPELKKRLKEFEKLLVNKKVTEPKIHKFLKSNTWMFGTTYIRMCKSEKPITIKSRNDFLLQRFDKYFDILDLKSPKFPLFVNIRGKKKAISGQLKDAISQVMQYLAEARTYYLSIREQTGIDMYFPIGIIVIGRRKNEGDILPSLNHRFEEGASKRLRFWNSASRFIVPDSAIPLAFAKREGRGRVSTGV